MREWISANDRLPKRGERCLCNSISDGIIVANCYCSLPWVEQMISKDGQISVSMQHKDVTHWQPLPEPPEGK